MFFILGMDVTTQPSHNKPPSEPPKGPPRRFQGRSQQTPSNPLPIANSMSPSNSNQISKDPIVKKLRSTKVKPKEISENLAWNTSKPDVMWCNVLCSWHGCHNPVRSSVQWAKSDSPLLRTSGEYCQWPKKSNKTHCSQTVNDNIFPFIFDKVHIFWEGHKSWQYLRFDIIN